MSVITIVIVLVILALCAYLIDTYVPMSPPIRVVVRAVIALLVVLWLLAAFGIWNGLNLRL